MVLAVALFALRNPKGHVTAAARSTTIIRTTIARSPSSAARRTHSSTPRPAPSSSSSSSSSSGSAAGVKSVPLIVLNNTTIPNLARQAGLRFEAGGWTVTSTGNLTNNIVSTCAYYDPADANARAAAQALQQQYPTIKRVEPRFAQLPAAPVVVVLTPDYQPA